MTSSRPRPRSRAVLVGATLLAVGLLSACASEPAATDSGSTSGALCPIAVADSWVKAADSGMTAAFGTLTNTGSTEAVVVSATSDAAGMVEIHEVVDKDGAMVMQPKEGGLLIPAGGSATLEPGGDHLMLMDIPAPIEPGDTVSIALTCADGGTAPYAGVAKPFDGAAEGYQPGSMESMGPTPSSS